MGEKDDYDSENSWISDGLPTQQKKEERRWEVGKLNENVFQEFLTDFVEFLFRSHTFYF